MSDFGDFKLLWPDPEDTETRIPEKPVLLAFIVQYGHQIEGSPGTRMIRVMKADSKGRITSSRDYEMKDIESSRTSKSIGKVDARWEKIELKGLVQPHLLPPASLQCRASTAIMLDWHQP
jgi:hypothetical protein